MAIQRLDNIGIVVADLDAAVAFFVELGMELEGRAPIEGAWAGSVVGLDGMRSEIAMMRVPGGSGRLELSTYHSPDAVDIGLGTAPSNTLGLHRVMFAVDDIDDTVERLGALGATLVGEIVRYEDAYRLCYLRGPEGIIVALAEELG
ncbi:glyoxalase [Oerskovia sp. Root918]|uniref:VOC family protein n=1 Tax=Oerskovia sp. Root918 TaxID=1736607 RepID=UPI0006FFD220|nr:VOC family protein [Oerskovia sp. Root918]KRD36579.1 glyoxalase [Oerskovia sp. Root918]